MTTGILAGVHCVGLPPRSEGSFDQLWSNLQACTLIHDNPQSDPQQLATIIYISGTTSTPNGRMHKLPDGSRTSSRSARASWWRRSPGGGYVAGADLCGGATVAHHCALSEVDRFEVSGTARGQLEDGLAALLA